MRINDVLKKENIGNEYWVNDNCVYFVWEDANGHLTLINDSGRDIDMMLSLEEIVNANYELVVDWTTVAVDTPILVREKETQIWKRRYFAKYELGGVYAWGCGSTSWSDDSLNDTTRWKYAKLYKGEGEE